MAVSKTILAPFRPDTARRTPPGPLHPGIRPPSRIVSDYYSRAPRHLPEIVVYCRPPSATVRPRSLARNQMLIVTAYFVMRSPCVPWQAMPHTRPGAKRGAMGKGTQKCKINRCRWRTALKSRLISGTGLSKSTIYRLIEGGKLETVQNRWPTPHQSGGSLRRLLQSDGVA